MKKVLIAILTVGIIIACQERQVQKYNVIDRNTYKEILKEIILANAVAQQLGKKDTLMSQELLGMVYKKYQVDSLKLKEMTDYYSKNPEVLAEIYQEIKDEFSKQKDSLQTIVSPGKPKSDSIKIPHNLLKLH